ncbi:MAG: hypothetical protein II705_08715 [Clostridia bacterium]|nr:hypothetical protein [Clostridia bacterium]MBQ4250109.1 hypothetical protein [Clostridia bacterium]
MNRDENKQSTTSLGSFIIYFVAAAFVLFLCMQGYNAIFRSVPTESASRGVATESFDVTGVVFRDEEMLYGYGREGMIDYIVDNGEKLARGATVAQYYPSQEDIDNRQKAAALEAELASYTDVLSSAQVGSSDARMNDLALDRNIQLIMNYNKKGDYKSSSSMKNEIRMLINRKRYIAGEATSFDAEIDEIARKLQEIGAPQSSVISEIYAPIGGYFSRNFDGYEERLNTYTMEYYDVPAIKDLMASAPDDLSMYGIGKVVASFEFYYVALVDKSIVDTLHTGQSVQIRFRGSEDMLYPATVSEMIGPYDNVYVVRFKSNYTSNAMTLERMPEAEIITAQYSGIRVPKSAVRMIDGKEGVFVLVGSIARFREIETQYLEGDYYIVREDNTSNNALLLGDQIIVQGTDIYEGKVMR